MFLDLPMESQVGGFDMRAFVAFAVATLAASAAMALDLDSFEIKTSKPQLRFGELLMDVVVENKNDFAIADVKIVCEALGASGTSITHWPLTIFQKFPAHTSKRVASLKVGYWPEQAKELSCRPTAASPVS